MTQPGPFLPAPLDYACSVGTQSRIALSEVQELIRDRCPFCQNQIDTSCEDHDVVGGKHFSYRLQPCEHCGWFSLLKFWEGSGNEIHAAAHWGALLRRFMLSQRDLDICDAVQVLMRDSRRVSELHHGSFERLAASYLQDLGFGVTDISRIKCSGGDLIAVDREGNRFLAEVKHLADPVGIDVVRMLIGALYESESKYEAGILIASSKFTGPALTSKAVRECRIALHDRDNLVEWLKLKRIRQGTTKSLCLDLIYQDVMCEM
jgi:hypothetical protein